jgi:hypothetical protein
LLFANNMLRHIYTAIAHFNPAPCFHCPISSLFANPPCVAHFFIYLENQLSWSWREYPSTHVPGLLSTVYPLLLHPTRHTLQIKLQYLHRRHQQHQPSHLIQLDQNFSAMQLEHVFRLILSTRDHLFLEFAWFLHSARPLDIREECPILIWAISVFLAEIQYTHDRVTSLFVDHFIPLWLK